MIGVRGHWPASLGHAVRGHGAIATCLFGGTETIRPLILSSILFALTLPLDASAFTKTALLAGHISYYFFTFAG
jgi:Zn-dependent protease with chaperone function